MDTGQYSTLMEALDDVPDPRKRRGKRHGWHMLLVLLVSGLASGYQNARAIAHWAKLHADELQQLLPVLQRIPSESTILRTMRQLDGAVVDRLVTTYTTGLSTASDQSGCIITFQGEVLQGQALDGKTVRGASAQGDKTRLVSLVQHGSAVTVAQTEVASKHNEITAAPTLLRDCDLHGTVTTGDALLTQRLQAQQTWRQGGHYLMIVKRNQRQLWDDLDLLFRIRAIPADHEIWDQVRTITKGRSGLIDLWRWKGWTNIADAVRERAASVQRTLILIGALPESTLT